MYGKIGPRGLAVFVLTMAIANTASANGKIMVNIPNSVYFMDVYYTPKSVLQSIMK